ncbi:hypothetical protein Poli38472_003420 [Pythium oligandrum]|uniref:TLC domain-containing protein n=1 Tax=Pythium oligandrum TaxID=41045 RepID=A0A8K1FBP5_PYTOL|nr:hypothetical protein Poli38472_003420 [Pythium oligandrum]|eukprot:TMW57495.1 hypothetical protein Poli38472_003420 [Pythium oligandrum]
MPCILAECNELDELKRFATTFVGIYVYHFVWDKLIISPIATWLVRHKYMLQAKRDKFRESMWKNAAVGTFFTFGLYIGLGEDWFMNPKGYFAEFPYVTPEPLRWYYMIYLSFWFQSVDFMLNITNKHYVVKRKDNAEMLVHHFATISLMVVSYAFDLTRIGICVLMIHDVNDLLLETAKIFMYVPCGPMADIFFALFAIVWFIMRWFVYAKYIIYAVHTEGWNSIVVPIQKAGGMGAFSADTWYWFYIFFFSFLSLLLALHVVWGYMIVKMVIRSLQEGKADRDIRSDSEAEDEDDKPVAKKAEPATDSKVKRRRAPKAE